MRNYPKILLGGPVSDHHDYCFDEFVNSIKSLTYPNFDVLLVDNSKDEYFFNKISKVFPTFKFPYDPSIKNRLSGSRNIVRQKVIDEGYDYLFCLDQDVVPPKDILEKLVSHEKNITTGVYYNEFTRLNTQNNILEKKILPMLWVKSINDPTKLAIVKKEYAESGQLLKIVMCGTGCILIHRSVLKNIKFKCEDWCDGVDDVIFCKEATEKGYEIYADTNIICKHLIENKTFKWGEGDMITKNLKWIYQ